VRAAGEAADEVLDKTGALAQPSGHMKYPFVVVLFAIFIFAVLCGVHARSIRDYLLNSAAKYSRPDSLSFRLQKWTMGNELYVLGIRATGFSIAALVSAYAVYLIVYAP
jgi:hypothetical protein